jgi:hypothetical protein
MWTALIGFVDDMFDIIGCEVDPALLDCFLEPILQAFHGSP